MIWLPYRNEVPDREKRMIESLTMMSIFIWNFHGFTLVDPIPKGDMFTAAYYIRISEIFSLRSLLSLERQVKGVRPCMRMVQELIQQM
jgi:hypothetical protein